MKKNLKGLTDQEVLASRQAHGSNELSKKPQESLWSMFLGAFNDIWIKVLCGALLLKIGLAVAAAFIPSMSGGNDVIEIISILIAIGLATGFSTVSEYRNTTRSEALQEEYNKTYAKVMRNGKLVNIYRAEAKKQDFGLIRNAFMRICDGNTGRELVRYNLSEDYAGKTAMIFGELYRRNGEWKMNAVGQGTADGSLSELMKRYV